MQKTIVGSQNSLTEPEVGIWGRIEGERASFDPENSTTGADYDVSTWKFETGVDGVVRETANGQLVGGLAFQYGTISADVSSIYGTGSIDATGYGLAGALTWYGNDGVYIDGQAQVNWFNSDLGSDTAGRSLANDNDAVGYILSLEAGKRLLIDQEWSVTPQTQLSWSSVDFDSFTDAFGARVSSGNSDSLVGRLGVSLDRQTTWKDASGRTGRTVLYGIANAYYDFDNGSDVDLAGATLTSENERLWGGLGIGATINWADDKYSVFGEARARTSLEEFGDSYALSGSVGFRVRW